MSAPVFVPTNGEILPGTPRWQPMIDWLTANLFEPTEVPLDAWICIRDETCLGVELYHRDVKGQIMITEHGEPARRVEWHSMVQAPPAVLLP